MAFRFGVMGLVIDLHRRKALAWGWRVRGPSYSGHRCGQTESYRSCIYSLVLMPRDNADLGSGPSRPELAVSSLPVTTPSVHHEFRCPRDEDNNIQHTTHETKSILLRRLHRKAGGDLELPRDTPAYVSQRHHQAGVSPTTTSNVPPYTPNNPRSHTPTTLITHGHRHPSLKN